jgi:hypothetical protein
MGDVGPRAAIALAALSAAFLIGCDAGESGREEPTVDLGAAPRSDLGQAGDGSFCTTIVNISASPPAAPGDFVYAPVELIAQATPNGSLGYPTWTVSLAGGGSWTPEFVDAQSGLTVRFAAALPGSYTFRVSFPSFGNQCRGENVIDVHERAGKVATYRLRVTPPESYGVPQQDQVIAIYGGTPVGGLDLSLKKGTPLTGTLSGPAGPIAGEVRLLADSGPDAVALAPATGGFTLAVNADGLYTPLLIPSASSLAPRLLAKASGTALVGSAFTVGAGESVSGTVMDALATPLAGARVVMRAGKLPSGAATSAADGTFALRAEAGSYTLEVGADGWPELTLTNVVVSAGTPLTVEVAQQLSRVAVAVKVVDSSGKPVAGARVTLRSAPLDAAATITVDGSARAAPGRVGQVAVSGADGTLPTLQLPLSSYAVLIEPPPGASDGVTAIARTLAGAESWTLALAPRNRLSGHVLDGFGAGVAGARVTAFESAGLGAAPSTVTDKSGLYTLDVDAGSPCTLLIEPPGEAKLASVRRLIGAAASGVDVTLPPGLLVSGAVLSPAGARMPSVVVEALCAACDSPSVLASAISSSAGDYALYLPDPGLEPFDGGLHD